MSLYYVQDTDRSMWVVATDFAEAVNKWRRFVAKENDCVEDDICDGPSGVQFVCDDDEFIP